MLVGLLILLLNSALVSFVAWRLARQLEDTADRLLAVLLLIPLQIIATGLILGYAGHLGATTFLIIHAPCALIAWRYLPPARPIPPPPTLTPTERLVLSVLSGLSALYLATAVFGQPLIHDGLSYRLSRIDHWLQEGTVLQFPTNELRQSYHPINVDLVMLWLTAPFPLGYPTAQLAQTYGGLLLLTATAALARECGLNRNGLFIAVTALFALPNVCVQWSSAQSDLLTAGLLWTGLYFLVRAPTKPTFIALGWCGVAAAVGAKGTVLYLAFGLLAFAACWWRSMAARRFPWRKHLAIAIPAMLLLAAPRYLENQFRFGNPFAPATAFKLNHGGADQTDWFKKTGLNLTTYFAQTLEPASNPPLIESLSKPIWHRLINSLPTDDPYDNTIYPRHEYLHEFGPTDRPGADTTSTGWPIPLLALIGTLAIFAKAWTPSSWRLLALAACGTVFILVFSALFVWWPTSFRYFTLVAPILTILAASLLGNTSPKTALAVLALAMFTAGDTYFRTKNSGLAQFKPDPRELLYLSDTENQKAVVNELLPAQGTLAVILPWDRTLAGFYRQTNSVRVELVRQQDLLHLPDAAYLRERGWNALVSLPLPIPEPAPGMQYLVVNHRVTGEPQYLIHLPQ